MIVKQAPIAALLMFAVGCGGDTQTKTTPQPALTPAPAAGAAGNAPVDGAPLATDGSKPKGESPFGPRRSDSDNKIAEIKANKDLSEDLKKQLIEEVERTYKEAQEGVKKN